MESISNKIQNSFQGQTSIFFLGQAGFVFKTQTGKLIGLDLYLSDCVERFDGYKRLIPHLLKPGELAFDYLLVSHHHLDHFDIDALPKMTSNGRTKLICAPDAFEQAPRVGIDRACCKQIDVGEEYVGEGFSVKAVFCDHGSSAPKAVGFILSVDGKKIYNAGDTCLRLDKASEIAEDGPFDVMIAPINGAFGNMNEVEMVTLCERIGPRLVIPAHYWLFAEHGGNPGLFMSEMRERLPNVPFRVMALGESFALK